MAEKSIFISHIAEEAGFATALKTQIESALPGVKAFSSSSDIGLGAQWLAQIDKALQKAGALLVLCSRRSVERRWINFEAGAGWGRKRPVIPVCHTELRVEDLPDPLRALQALELRAPEDCKLLVQRISHVLKRDVNQSFNFQAMASALRPQLPQRKPIIAIDLSHGQTEWDRTLGSTFDVANSAPNREFFPIHSSVKFLSNEFWEAAGLLFGSPWRHRIAPDTVDIIKDWVFKGGRLLMLGYELGDLHHNANLGLLGEAFAIQFSTDIVGPPQYGPLKPYGVPVTFYVSQAEPHALTAGLEEITLSNVQTLSVAPGGIEWLRVGSNVVYRPRRDTVDFRGGTLVQPVSKDCDLNHNAAWLPVAVEAPRGLTGDGGVCAIGTWQILNPKLLTGQLWNRLLNWLVNV